MSSRQPGRVPRGQHSRLAEGVPWRSSDSIAGEKSIRRHSSRGLAATRIAAGEGKIHLTCLTVEPGGVIGTHPATSAQLFLVIAGVRAGSPEPMAVTFRSERAGRSLECRRGAHQRTETGFIALAVEGAPLDLFEPELSLARASHPPGSSSTFTAPVRPGSFSATSAFTGTYRKLFGQIIVRHMCATGDPSKPNPSVGCSKFRPTMLENSSNSTVTFGSNE